MISRAEALSLVENHLSKKNLVKHVLAVEIIMRALAVKFGEDEEVWGMAGLLHDLDYERTEKTPGKHGYLSLELLRDRDVSEEILHAILAHAGQVERVSLMDKAIYCTDPVTGLIVASALMHPTKSLAGMDRVFVEKRYREKRFAAGANREIIATCSELGLELHEFLGISLDAMTSISGVLGL
ncbi:MAG: HDIG domain-containing protein [Candidatus Krumholzibacteriota bacterium]|nr:HDIG domain-containing protein [Candidatus Krumholzibacteriota bacterium]